MASIDILNEGGEGGRGGGGIQNGLLVFQVEFLVIIQLYCIDNVTIEKQSFQRLFIIKEDCFIVLLYIVTSACIKFLAEKSVLVSFPVLVNTKEDKVKANIDGGYMFPNHA